MTEQNIIVKNVVQAGAANAGDFLTLTIQTNDGQQLKLGFPASMGPGLLGAITAAIGLVHQEQLKKLGSEQAVLDHIGTSPIQPTAYEVGTARQGDTELVLLRLKKERVPLIDVLLSSEGAADMGEQLQAISARPLEGRKPQ